MQKYPDCQRVKNLDCSGCYSTGAESCGHIHGFQDTKAPVRSRQNQ